MNKPAFTIIELLVYATLFSFFILVAFGFVGVIHRFLLQDQQTTQQLLKNALVMDMIYRDCLGANMNADLWDAAHGVWYKEYCDAQGVTSRLCVGWEVVQEKNKPTRIRRNEGLYDFAQHRWIKRSVSGVDSSLTSLVFTLQFSKDCARVIRVVIRGDVEGHIFQRTVVMRNRVLS